VNRAHVKPPPVQAPAPRRGARRRRRPPQQGVAAVEFALLAVIFLLMVFGVIEIARLLYVFNTLQEVTRRAVAGAVNVQPRAGADLDRVRYDAVFRTGPGNLILAAPVSDEHLRIDYLALTRASSGALTLTEIPTASLPASAAENKHNCLCNPNALNCIRFVRARICDPSATTGCNAVQSQMIVPMVTLGVTLHLATTIAAAESLGYRPGTAPATRGVSRP
jgi:Flp pilus assembly protein TadG